MEKEQAYLRPKRAALGQVQNIAGVRVWCFYFAEGVAALDSLRRGWTLHSQGGELKAADTEWETLTALRPSHRLAVERHQSAW